MARWCSTSLLKIVKDKPDNYFSAYTKYGWFLVPKHVFSDGWTQTKINLVLRKLPELKGVKSDTILFDDPRYEKLQEAVDQWAESVDRKDVPAAPLAKLPKKRKEEEDQMEYIRQSLGSHRTVVKNGETVYSSEKHERVTFTHAWNYFRSLYALSPETKKMTITEVAQKWKVMDTFEKDKYRLKYIELLKSGKDTYRGKIMDKSEKDEIVRRKKANKGTKSKRKIEL